MAIGVTSKLGLSFPTLALAMRCFPFLRRDSALETRPNRHSAYQRRAGWVVEGGEEKQTGVCWVGLTAAELRGGGEQERAEGACLLQELHRTQLPTDQLTFLAVKFLDLLMNPAMLLKPRKRTLVTVHTCAAQYDFKSPFT